MYTDAAIPESYALTPRTPSAPTHHSGNMCAHAACAVALGRLDLGAVLGRMLEARGGDAVLQRYVARIHAKLAAHGPLPGQTGERG